MSEAATIIPHRGPRGDHAIVRCADEGVPIGAIARIFKCQRGEVIDILEDAKALGQILDLPKHDWPAGQPRDEREPQPRRPRLEDSEELQLELQAALRLTAAEATLLSAMIARPGTATRAYLHAALYSLRPDDDVDPKIIDVLVCKLRKKLRGKVQIETVWGRGYRLSPESISAIRATLERQRQTAVLEAAE